MKILLIDNYDSFTYNLYQFISELGAKVEVIRNDKLIIDDIWEMNPDGIVISPGPCTPIKAGISNDVVSNVGGHIPILGVCLGHQSIGFSYGARVDVAEEIMHGKTSLIYHDGKGVFKNLENPFEAIRYHSLVVYKENLPAELEISAQTEKGLIMGIRHRTKPVEGVQFHPESIMSEEGHHLLQNFLDQVNEWR